MTSPIAPTIDVNGISAPTFADIMAYLTAQYQAIYGADAYVAPDSQDGNFLAMVAQGWADINAAIVAVYNAYSPSTAQGAGLSSVVKINGLRRIPASASVVTVTISGTVGTNISNGSVKDTAGNIWNLPALVTIPGSGSIDVLATAAVVGAIAAAPGTVTGINTPVFGWQSVTNAAAATLGQAVETDAQLRVRQAQSVELPSTTIFDGIWSLLETVTNVTRVRGYENNTGSTDGNGVPAHSLAFIVEGGVAADIENAIASKIAPGVGAYGTTSGTVTDSFGSTRTIGYSIATPAAVHVNLTVKQLTGYSSAVGLEIQNDVMAYVNALPIGTAVNYFALVGAAYLALSKYPGTYGLNVVQLAKNGGGFSAADVAISWNEVPTNIIANTVLTLV